MPSLKHQITCVIRTNNKQAHKCISHIGGYNGSHWRIALDNAIEGIEKGKWQFFIEHNGQIIPVSIGEINGRKYLKGATDNDRPDSLLALPDCF